MQIIEKSIKDIKPYDKNPRKNDSAVDAVANSISQFGFKVPVVIDKDDVIVCGHTRYKAAKKLGLSKVPCVVADDLTDEQTRLTGWQTTRYQSLQSGILIYLAMNWTEYLILI